MTNNMDIASFMQIVSKLLNEPKNAKVIIHDDASIHKIITKLPERYEMFVKMALKKACMLILDMLGAWLEETNLKLQSEIATKEGHVIRFRHFITQAPTQMQYESAMTINIMLAGRFNEETFRSITSRQQILFDWSNKPECIARYCLAYSFGA